MIMIYGKKDCKRCLSLKKILKDKQISYAYIEDEIRLRLIESKYRIMSAPVVEFDNKFYSMENFIEKLEKMI